MGMLLRRRSENEKPNENMTRLADVTATEDAQDKPIPEAQTPVERPKRGRPKKS